MRLIVVYPIDHVIETSRFNYVSIDRINVTIRP